MTDHAPLPALRPLDVRRVMHEGRSYFFLRDSLGLSEQQLLVPDLLAPVLALLDGTRTVSRLRAELTLRFGLPLDERHITDLVRRLSDACLLNDQVFAAALRHVRDQYRAAPFRAPAHADAVYPADPAALTAALRGFEAGAGAAEDAADGVVGLISPHIDYNRGGPLYAALFRRAAAALRAAEVAVIFGTDHAGGPGRLTLTHRPYATPWGTLPNDPAAVDAMAAALGGEAAFDEEIHHRGEHSIELATVWLHYAREGAPITVVPVLCGHPLPFMKGATGSRGTGHGAAGNRGGDAGSGQRGTRGTMVAGQPGWEETGTESSDNGWADDVRGDAWARAMAALDALRDVTAGRRVVAIAAADLAHVGPAFGDPEPFAPPAKHMVRMADEALLAACSKGPGAVLRCVGRIEDRYRICGLSPIALTLAFTGPVFAETAGYDQCPADHDGGDGSIVSIAGVILRQRDG